MGLPLARARVARTLATRRTSSSSSTAIGRPGDMTTSALINCSGRMVSPRPVQLWLNPELVDLYEKLARVELGSRLLVVDHAPTVPASQPQVGSGSGTRRGRSFAGTTRVMGARRFRDLNRRIQPPDFLLHSRVRISSCQGHTHVDEFADILPGRRHDPMSDRSSSGHKMLERTRSPTSAKRPPRLLLAKAQERKTEIGRLFSIERVAAMATEGRGR